ncbi:hypothetical protein SRHO_G00110730 [Serrasalmus rhombeus]
MFYRSLLRTGLLVWRQEQQTALKRAPSALTSVRERRHSTSNTAMTGNKLKSMQDLGGPSFLTSLYWLFGKGYFQITHQMQIEHSKIYGSLWRSKYGPMVIVNVASAELIEQVLRQEGRHPIRTDMPHWRTYRELRKQAYVEAEDSEYAGAPWLGTNSDRASEHVARLRQTAKKLAADAGFGSLREEDRACAKTRGDAQPKVNKDGNHGYQPQVKTQNYSGRADWEAFRAQFELLARAVGWSEDMKALQLALCLTDEALTCLLLLSPAERGDYGALVGALERRFGQCNQPGVLRSELASRQRLSGEPLRALANDIETLTRRD